jgi:TMEM175 potassium channel family protein
MKDKRQPKPDGTKEKGPLRLIGLTDGLFATVLTLLVLDLKIPDALSTSNGDIHTFVKWLGPHLFSYLLTFLVAGTYWFAHHRDFDLIIRSDRRLLGYNLMFLLFIGLLPFSTAAVSLGPLRQSIYPFYWTIYAVNIVCAGVMLTLSWAYAFSHQLVDPNTTREQSRLIIVRQMIVPVVFIVSIGTEYLFPQYALGPLTLIVIPLALAGVDRSLGTKEQKTQPADGLQDLLWRAGSVLPWVLVIGLAAWAMTF